MRHFVYSLIALLFLFSNRAVSQQVVQTRHTLASPTLVNFTERAEYQKLHPVKKEPKFIEQGEERAEKVKMVHKPVPAGSPVFNFDEPKAKEPGFTAASPAPKISFNGTMDNGTLIPPDVQGAAGPTYLMQTTNQSLDIRTKTGTLVKSVSPDGFFGQVGGMDFFDPHVYYDPNYGRYLMCIAGNLPNYHSAIFVGVSVTNDPTGSWYVFSHDGTGNTTDFLDFPLMGYNANWIVVTSNIFTGSNTVFAEISVFDRAAVYNGTGGTVVDFKDNNGSSLSPAQTQDVSQPKEYIISDYNGNYSSKGYMEICTISGAVNNPVYTAVSTVGVNRPWSENPVDAVQRGTSNGLDAGDTRLGSGVVYINGSVWFAHHVFLPAIGPTHIGVDWWQIDPGTPAVQQFGRIEDATGATDYLYPSISVNALGDALLGYCESGTGMYASSSYSFHANTDAANVMEDTYIAKAGLASYYKTLGGGRNRYGDFTFTAVDPTDNSFWNFSEWANTGSNWATYITNVAGSSTAVCFIVSGMTTSAVTDRSATFSWNAISNATSYTIHYRQVGTTTWTTATTSSTTYSVSGLTGNTNYEWQVQTSCSTGGSSGFTASTIFVTQINCNISAPVASSVTICSGNQAVLNATGSDSLYWYSVISGGSIIGRGRTFTTPALTSNSTYYVESDVYPAIKHVGASSNGIGAGGYFTNGIYYHDLIFDCSSPVKLLSVLVYASGAGNRTITLKDQLGNLLKQVTVNIPDGTSRVNLNFDIPVGTNMELGIEGNVGLYRNTDGAAFPYTIANAISITGTNATTSPNYYYYFYDWQIVGTICKSARVPVLVSVLDPVAAFGYSTTGDSVAFDDQSYGATRWSWNFGDGTTSTGQNPAHIYSSNGTYTVKEVVCNGNCCDSITHSVTITITGNPLMAEHSLRILPNPFGNNVLITFSDAFKAGCTISIINSTGQMVVRKTITTADLTDGYLLNTSSFAVGIYNLLIENEGSRYMKKIVKE